MPSLREGRVALMVPPGLPSHNQVTPICLEDDSALAVAVGLVTAVGALTLTDSRATDEHA